MKEIEVMAPDKKKWLVPLENLGDALELGGEIIGLGERIKVIDENGKTWNIKSSNLGEAYKRGATLGEPDLIDRAKEFGQGVAQGLGTIPDLANQVVGAPVAHLGGYAVEGASKVAGAVGMEGAAQELEKFGQSAHELGEEYRNSDVGKNLASSEILQTNTLPDKTSEVLKTSGEFATDVLPFSLASKGVSLIAKNGGKVVSPWLTKLDKWMKVEPNLETAVSFAGMGAGKELLHSNEKDVSEVEQVGREVVGMIAGGVVAGPLASAPLKGIYEMITHPLETLKKIPNPKELLYKGLGKIVTGNKINKEAIEGAEELGIQLTPKDLSNSGTAAFIQNNLLKSVFTSEVYNEVIEKAPLKLIENIGETFEKIGPQIAGTEEGSAVTTGMQQYKELLEGQKKEWTNQSNSLYEEARKLPTEADKTIPSLANDFIEKHLKEGSKSTLSPGEGEKVFIDTLNQLKNDYSKSVPIEVLFEDVQRLYSKAGDAQDHRALLNTLAGIIKEDISHYTGNAEFSKAWKIATEFNKEMIQTRVKTDIARSILDSSFPEETIKYMNDAAGVKHLEKIIGTDLKGEAGTKANLIMDKLKRARTEQFFLHNNIIKSDATFNTTQFLNIFERNKNEDFLKAIMGTNYNTIKNNITPIASIMEQSAKRLTNYSNTVPMGKDAAIIGTAGFGAMSGNPFLIAKAAAAAGSINILSRIFADPKFAQTIIQRGRMLDQVTKKTWEDIIREIGEMPSTKYSIGHEVVSHIERENK